METKTAKRSFRAMRQMKLHQRAVDVLDMIVKCDNYYADAEDNLKRWDKATWWEMPKLVYTREYLERYVNKYAAIKQRLTAWYIDIMGRIEDVAILHINEQNENY